MLVQYFYRNDFAPIARRIKRMKIALKIIASVIGLLVALKLIQYGIDCLYRKYGRRYITAGDAE